ncbi:MAG: hypothetical protein WC997_10565 [Porticoccaceae bacterium]
MNWQDIQNLRKTGQLKEAREAALRILADDPRDFKTKSELEWVLYGFIKRAVERMEAASEANEQIDRNDINEATNRMVEFYKLSPQVPGWACSKILWQLSKVGQHIPRFLGFVRWVGLKGMGSEDWNPTSFQETTLQPVTLVVARALCKWIKAHPDASVKDMAFALEWAEEVRSRTHKKDTLWLRWDMAILLRQMGDFQRATELLTSVIKEKRNEFWVWAEAGRLYQSEQPELALSCFCRALECPAESKFLVKAHRELAELLAEQEEYAQASREVAVTIDIRQAEGWPIGREMEALIASSWYDPSADRAEDPKAFYARHSAAALALCFDVVETKAASYLGLLIPHTPKEPRPGWKPKPLPRFAIKDGQGKAWSLIGSGMKKLKFEVGAPVTVVIGRQHGENRETIVHVSARQGGKHWDCLELGVGVVVREASDEKPLKVFIAGTGNELGIENPSAKSLRVGDGVRLGIARNPKNDRLDAFTVERGDLPESDVKYVQGQLRRNQKGFAFVDDAFVAPHLVETVASDVDEVNALAVFAKHPKKGELTWRVIKLSEA